MKEDDFLDLVKDTRLSKASREAARLVFVDGLSQAEAGVQCGQSKQRMSAIVATVRRVEQERQSQSTSISGNELVAAVDASYAFAVKAARDELGDQVRIGSPSEQVRTVGPIIARTDFHLVQSLGRDSVMVHELAKLDRVPTVGQSVAIQYDSGRGMVVDRERQRGGQSR